MFATVWKNRELIWQLTQREILSRYRGSLLGIFWSFLTPLFLLAVYTFIFGVVFETRWGTSVGNKGEFALVLFCGLTAYNIFAETVGRAPGVIIGNPNYTKKVVFPLEILPVTVLGSSLVNGLIGLLILLAANIVLAGAFHWTIIFLPVVLVPLLLMTMGLSWFLASLGVYLRDVGQVVPIITMALLFMSPIFYPVSAIPESFHFIYYINPLCYVLEDALNVILWGKFPNWMWMGIGTSLGLAISFLGFLWFQKTRKGFADVM